MTRHCHCLVEDSRFSRFKVSFLVSYLSVFEEVQCYLYILKFVESHAAFLSGLRRREKR